MPFVNVSVIYATLSSSWYEAGGFLHNMDDHLKGYRRNIIYTDVISPARQIMFEWSTNIYSSPFI